jgi:hypothetical protein
MKGHVKMFGHGPHMGHVGPAVVNSMNIGGCGMNLPAQPKGPVQPQNAHLATSTFSPSDDRPMLLRRCRLSKSAAEQRPNREE